MKRMSRARLCGSRTSAVVAHLILEARARIGIERVVALRSLALLGAGRERIAFHVHDIEGIASVGRVEVGDDGVALAVQPAALLGLCALRVGDRDVGDVLFDGGDECEEHHHEEHHTHHDEGADGGDELHERIRDYAEEHAARRVHAVVARDEIAAVVMVDEMSGRGINVERPHPAEEHQRELRDLRGTRLDAEIEDDRHTRRRGDEAVGKIRKSEEPDKDGRHHVPHSAERAAIADEHEKRDEQYKDAQSYPVARIGSHLSGVVHLHLPASRIFDNYTTLYIQIQAENIALK